MLDLMVLPLLIIMLFSSIMQFINKDGAVESWKLKSTEATATAFASVKLFHLLAKMNHLQVLFGFLRFQLEPPTRLLQITINCFVKFLLNFLHLILKL